MSFLSKLTVTPLLYACGGLVVLCLVLGGVVAYKDARLDAARAELKAEQDKLAACGEANKANVATIGRLEVANNAWAKACRLPDGAQEAAIAALRAENARLARELVDARENREVIYANDPEARAWAVDGMPADVADGLWPRERPR